MRITMEYDTKNNMVLTTVVYGYGTIFADADSSDNKHASFQRIVDTMRTQGIHDYDVSLFKTIAHLQYDVVGLV